MREIKLCILYSQHDYDLYQRILVLVKGLTRILNTSKKAHFNVESVCIDEQAVAFQFLNQFHIVMPLVSMFFIYFLNNWEVSLRQKRELHKNQTGDRNFYLIPIIIKACNYDEIGVLNGISKLPQRKDFHTYKDIDEACADVSKGLKQTIERLLEIVR